jgi:hypothetical protein
VCSSDLSGIGKTLRLKSGLSEQWIDCVQNLKKGEVAEKVTDGGGLLKRL